MSASERRSRDAATEQESWGRSFNRWFKAQRAHESYVNRYRGQMVEGDRW